MNPDPDYHGTDYIPEGMDGKLGSTMTVMDRINDLDTRLDGNAYGSFAFRDGLEDETYDSIEDAYEAAVEDEVLKAAHLTYDIGDDTVEITYDQTWTNELRINIWGDNGTRDTVEDTLGVDCHATGPRYIIDRLTDLLTP